MMCTLKQIEELLTTQVFLLVFCDFSLKNGSDHHLSEKN